MADDQATEAPRDCKHGQLRRTCQLCELEAEEHILRYGGVIEVAVRNSSVAEYMRHWEGRATKAEARISALEAELVAARSCNQHQGALRTLDRKIVAAAVLAEREACAKVCEEMSMGDQPFMCAAAIRGRGDASQT